MGSSGKAISLQNVALLAAAAQVGLLCAWSVQGIWLWAPALVLTFGGLGVCLKLSSSGKIATWARWLRTRPLYPKLSFGGLGMLLGAWVDAGFCVPPCMCCRWGPTSHAWTQAADVVWTWSALGMGLGCLAPLLGRFVLRGRPIAGSLPHCMMEFTGMWLGMALVMRPASAAMRLLPWGKLAVGHVAMLLGMGVGTYVCSTAAWALAKPRH